MHSQQVWHPPLDLEYAVLKVDQFVKDDSISEQKLLIKCYDIAMVPFYVFHSIRDTIITTFYDMLIFLYISLPTETIQVCFKILAFPAIYVMLY